VGKIAIPKGLPGLLVSTLFYLAPQFLDFVPFCFFFSFPFLENLNTFCCTSSFFLATTQYLRPSQSFTENAFFIPPPQFL